MKLLLKSVAIAMLAALLGGCVFRGNVGLNLGVPYGGYAPPPPRYVIVQQPQLICGVNVRCW